MKFPNLLKSRENNAISLHVVIPQAKVFEILPYLH